MKVHKYRVIVTVDEAGADSYEYVECFCDGLRTFKTYKEAWDYANSEEFSRLFAKWVKRKRKQFFEPVYTGSIDEGGCSNKTYADFKHGVWKNRERRCR